MQEQSTAGVEDLLDSHNDLANYWSFFGFCISENNLLITGWGASDVSSVKSRLVPFLVSMVIEKFVTPFSPDSELRGTVRQSIEATNLCSSISEFADREKLSE